MQSHQLLGDLLILFGFATAVAVLLRRARQSTVVAYLLTGLVVGPSGLGLISNRAAIELMAEIGVVLLLFSIGIEFSIGKLLSMRRLVVGAGARQVGLTIVVTLGTALLIGYPWQQGLFWGFLIAASSTAIVLRLLHEREELESLHGRAILGILLFQDLCVVPMMAVLPAFTAPPGQMVVSGLLSLGEALLIGGAILLSARYFYPALWRYIVRLGNKEIFLIAAIFFSLGTAWISSLVGLTLAMGAFLAGLALSESDYAHQILSDLLPLRDGFASLFFISVGMLLNLEITLQHSEKILLFAGGILAVKLLAGAVAVLTMGFSLRISVLVGLSLAQVGEFSFILLHEGAALKLINETDYQAFLAATIITMFLTPTLVQVAPLLATRLAGMRGLARWHPQKGERKLETDAERLRDHAIVCGYGLNGKLVAQALRQVEIPHLVLEIDPVLVSSARLEGVPIFFGDSTQPEILKKAGADRARTLVFAISDPLILPRAIANARALNPQLSIVVRTGRVKDTEGLERVGASQIVAAEREAAVEIIIRVLQLFGISRREAFNRSRWVLSQFEREAPKRRV